MIFFRDARSLAFRKNKSGSASQRRLRPLNLTQRQRRRRTVDQTARRFFSPFPTEANFSPVSDHYHIGKKLGQGQFSTTYLCVAKEDGGEYACKSIPKCKLLCCEDYEDAWREIQIMHHLSEHPNVVRIRSAYEDALFVHIVMELCAGGGLFDRIVAKGHYSERAVAQLIRTIVGVMEGCHSLGVMHRDLKPENFL